MSLRIGGVTLHAFAGIGGGDATLQRCYELASRPTSAQAWRKCKRLIIDEISMVDGQYFDVSTRNLIRFNGSRNEFECYFERHSKCAKLKSWNSKSQ